MWHRNVANEYLKHSINSLLPVYSKLFNVVFKRGVIPVSWLNGCIIPIFKNKGNINAPGNYRPITRLSCMWKVFTSILNKRLNSFVEENNL